MLTSENQQALNEREDMKLAVDGMRAVFRSNGRIQPKHQRALDALGRFCKIGTYNHGDDQTEILRITGRREVYNYIMFCLEYPVKEQRKLKTQIKELEEIRDDTRRTDRPDDD